MGTEVINILAKAAAMALEEVERLALPQHQPGLGVDRRGSQPHAFQGLPIGPGGLLAQRRGEVSVEEKLAPIAAGIRLDGAAHGPLPQRGFSGAAQRRHDRHDLIRGQVYRPFKADPVHGTGDDRGANAPGGGVEDQLLEGIAGGLQIHGRAFGDRDGEIELRPRDNALGVQLFISFRAGVIQHLEAQRNCKGRHNIVYIII